MPRNVGSIPSSWFTDENIVRFEYLIIYFTTGREFWTNAPGDARVEDIGNGEGTQTWDGTKVWTPGQFEQAEQNALAVSDITFGNADNSISDKMRAQGTYGFRGIRLDAWVVAFEKAPPHTFIDNVLVYSGVMDRAEVIGETVRLSILSFRNPITSKFPRRRYSLAWGFNWIPPQNLKIKFGSQTLTLPTPSRPSAPVTGPPGTTPPPPPGPGPTGRGPVVRVGHPRPVPRKIFR